MLSQSLRASRQGLARVTRQHAFTVQRSFVTSTVRQADHVQDMYIRELKNYKAPQVKATDSEGHVQKFSLPKTPASPEEGDLASDLKTYESQTVEVEGQSESGPTTVANDEWFEGEDYSEDDHKDAHH